MSGRREIRHLFCFGAFRERELKVIAMDYPVKTCPRCQTQLRQGDGAFELVRKGPVGSESLPGLSVTLYSCPTCGYIELYDLKVVGRL